MRLSRLGYEIGLLPSRNYLAFNAKEKAIQVELERLVSNHSNGVSLAKKLSRPDASYKDLGESRPALDLDVMRQIEIGLKYGGYITRQNSEVSRLKDFELKKIPDSVDFNTLTNLRLEARQKLSKIRPKTIGQASRISGVSPSDLSVLLIWLKKNKL